MPSSNNKSCKEKNDDALSDHNEGYPNADLINAISPGTGVNPESLVDTTLIPQIIDGYETRFLGVLQSELYKPAGMILPKLPIYHPYHPFKNVTHGDNILQVPLAIILPNTDQVPRQLLEHIAKRNIAPLTPYFIAQTLPYESETEVICRYQYALFPEAKCEMKGQQSMWAQSIIYERDKEFAHLPATAVKICESDKDAVSPTILCGDSMKLDTVVNLGGKGIWSLVVGSKSGALDEDGFLSEITQVFVGFTFFIPDDHAYEKFLLSIRNKSPTDVMSRISSFLEDITTSTDIDAGETM
ncbi:hypothetical protein ACHAW5_009331 [Stephanodiscus triporus]|uniref:Uncharacterized protein n=1 Tax=Stephanodiscus triporus TaxID=2934178 RepID=A0ABD3NAY1_9STRA